MTRRELLQRLGLDEYWLQVAFERIEPFENGYIQSARLISYLARKLGDDYELSDIWPHFADQVPEKESSEAEFALAASLWVKALNAKVAKGEQSVI